MKALLFSRWGAFLHELNLYSCEQYMEINGEDYIDIKTDEPLAKGDRILIQDCNEDWFEYVFNEGEQVHDGNQTYSMTCDNSLMWDLSLKHIRYAGWDSADCKYAVTELLKLHPLWSVGTVLSTSRKKLVYERETAWQALLETCGTFNCEMQKSITVDKNGVVKRTLSLMEHIGERRDVRFDYGNGIYGVTKTINSDPVLTACYGYGSGTGDEDLWCYVTNDGALREWGLPGGGQVIHHAEGDYTNNDVEDAATLRQLTTDYLNGHSAPSITYEMDEPYLALQGVRLGDTVQSVDADFYPPVRLETRIGSMERDLLTNIVTKAVYGNVISYLPDALSRSYDQQKVIIKQTAIIGELRGDLADTQNSLRDATSSLSQAEGNISKLQKDLSNAQKELSDTTADLDKALSDLETAKSDAAAAKKKAEGLDTQLGDAKTRLTNAEKDLSAKDKTITSLNNRVGDLEDSVSNWLASSARYSNAYNDMVTIGDIWLRARRGQPLYQSDRKIIEQAYATYQREVQNGVRRNESIEQIYNETILALDEQGFTSADEGGEPPSTGDQGTDGPSDDADASDDATDTPSDDTVDDQDTTPKEE